MTWKPIKNTIESHADAMAHLAEWCKADENGECIREMYGPFNFAPCFNAEWRDNVLHRATLRIANFADDGRAGLCLTIETDEQGIFSLMLHAEGDDPDESHHAIEALGLISDLVDDEDEAHAMEERLCSIFREPSGGTAVVLAGAMRHAVRGGRYTYTGGVDIRVNAGCPAWDMTPREQSGGYWAELSGKTPHTKIGGGAEVLFEDALPLNDEEAMKAGQAIADDAGHDFTIYQEERGWRRVGKVVAAV